jgi:Tol biopolymer transport system component
MMETLPEWSHDGKYLYFCSAPQPKDMKFSFVYNKDYKNLKYSLMRIAYDAGSNKWGELETVISSSATGLSITQPKPSPDGRFLMFNMASYGNFSIYNITSDLYILDLRAGKYFKPEINSDRSDSYHAWSSNSKWVVFSSKRDDGIHTRLYFCHVDTNGNTSKPFVLPQEDPGFYSTDLLLYNVPEFVNAKVTFSQDILADASRNLENEIQAELDPDIEVKEKDTEETGQMWRPAVK